MTAAEPEAGWTRRSVLGLGGAVLGTGLLSALSGCASPAIRSLEMACGEPGGTYIRFGQLLASSVERAGIAARMRVRETEGSVQNLELLRTGEVRLAISLADAVPDPPAGLAAIGRVYQNYLQCIVPEGRTGLTELRGHAVSIGAAGSGTALSARRVLDALDLLGDGGVEPREMRLSDAVQALGEGSIGALFWSGGVPLPALSALGEGTPIAPIDLTAALDLLRERYPRVYHPTAIPAGVYGLRESLPSIGVPNLLLVREDEQDHLAAALVDRLIDDASRLVPDPSVGVQFLTPSNLIDTASVPLHPAARRRYRERHG